MISLILLNKEYGMKIKFVFLNLLLISSVCFANISIRTIRDTPIYDRHGEIGEYVKQNTVISASGIAYGNFKLNKYLIIIKEMEKYISAEDVVLATANDFIPFDMVSKIDDCYMPAYYFTAMKKNDIKIIEKKFTNSIQRTKENPDIYDSDWKKHVVYYDGYSSITQIALDLRSFYSSQTWLFNKIEKDGEYYKIKAICYGWDKNEDIGLEIPPIENNEYTIFLRFDGDYFSIYLNNKNTLIQTFVRTDSQTNDEYQKFIKHGSCNLSRVTWPRHADGTCDYETTVRLQSGKRYRASDNLRLRASGSTAGKPVVTIGKGTQVKVLSIGTEQTIDGITSNWVQVEVQAGAKDRDGKPITAGTVGWCFGGYLQ